MIPTLPRFAFALLSLVLFLVSSVAAQTAAETDAAPVTLGNSSFYVIPVEGPIDPTTLFAVRGGVKQAIEDGYKNVVLDMDTPGGRLDVTLEIMEILDRFPGRTITYVNDEAISAGAIISAVTDEIYFAPKAIIGAAEAVSGGGQDIPESMKRKLTSYLNAKVEAYTDQYPFRGDVIRAMMDPKFEFVIDEVVISKEGELLSLTANKAHQEFGDPPVPLLGSGIVDDLDSLLASLSMTGEPQVERYTATWSLELAKFIVMLTPLLIAIGVITIYVEFQVPGFGVFGILGVICFLIAFFGHNVAGLSGHEPMLLFLLGILLLTLEVFVAPGTLLFAIPGFIAIGASLLWAMADVWPEETPDYKWEWSSLVGPFQNLMVGSLLGIVIILILARFLPKTPLWNRMVLAEAVTGSVTRPEADVSSGTQSPEVGALAVAASGLMPSGEIEYQGKRYEARLSFGSAPKGSEVRVVAKTDFGYTVEKVES